MTEKDAEILDYIVAESLKFVCLHARDLKPLDNGFLSDIEESKESAYTYYFDILKEKNVVRVEKEYNDKTRIYPIDIKTKEFIRQGGFKKEVQDELKRVEKERKKEELEIDLAISNLEANRLNKSIADKNDKKERKNTIGMWVNISVGVLNIVLLAIQIWLIVCKA